ncbi:MAG: hypothetical protein IJF83_08700 [Methanobrevibacter sp.]|nr:hypothetical protein [Methanobrevibacter sp.]MBR0371826.1 hypothetical protein [Methanobrevibacter sp.]
MIKLLKDTSKSITDANYNEFSYALTVLSVMGIIVLSIITGVDYFATTPVEMGNLSLIAQPGDKIWLIGLIIVIISIVFGVFTLFADSHYKADDDRRFLVAGYFWVFATCSGALLIVMPFILLYDITKYLFYAVNFCLEHFFMLFAPRKTKEKMIVREKTEKEMINTYNNFLRN